MLEAIASSSSLPIVVSDYSIQVVLVSSGLRMLQEYALHPLNF